MIRPRLVLAALLVAVPLFAASLIHAQDAEKPQHLANESTSNQESYLLTLTIKISDHGKVTTEQTSTFTANSRSTSPSSRDGDRIPVVSSSEEGKTQIQYIDMGTLVDILDVKRLGSALACNVRIEISAPIPSPTLKDDPIVRGSKFSVSPAIPLNKQVTIYSSNDAVTGRKVEIQLEAQVQSNL
jgi:hypothetical protein